VKKSLDPKYIEQLTLYAKENGGDPKDLIASIVRMTEVRDRIEKMSTKLFFAKTENQCEKLMGLAFQALSLILGSEQEDLVENTVQYLQDRCSEIVMRTGTLDEQFQILAMGMNPGGNNAVQNSQK
jgi:hypothetical protein